MGKGKGLFLRWVIKLTNNFFFLEFLTFYSKFFYKYIYIKKNIISPYLAIYQQN